MTPERNYNLQLALMSKGMKQKELAVAVGIRPYAMTLIMRGVRTPTKEVAQKIAAVLDATTGTLWSGLLDKEDGDEQQTGRHR